MPYTVMMVAAAGGSTRMGQPKQHIRLGQHPVLIHTLTTLQQVAAIAEQYENILRVELEPYHSLEERKNVALGREEHKFKEPAENEKNLWLDAVRNHTDKKVIFA